MNQNWTWLGPRRRISDRPLRRASPDCASCLARIERVVSGIWIPVSVPFLSKAFSPRHETSISHDRLLFRVPPPPSPREQGARRRAGLLCHRVAGKHTGDFIDARVPGQGYDARQGGAIADLFLDPPMMRPACGNLW